MICISSPAGVRMTKAYAAMNAAHDDMNTWQASYRDKAKYEVARERYFAAAEEVPKELITQNLHEMTGP